MKNEVARIYDSSCIFPVVYCSKEIDMAINTSRSRVLLLGRILNIMNARRIVHYVKSHQRYVFVDIDLVGGLNQDEQSINFLTREVGADGIISTHRNAILLAKKKKVLTVLKIFVYDEHSLESALQNIDQCRPDILEVLPGVVLPLVVDKIKSRTDIPINASGFMDVSAASIAHLLDLGVSGLHISDPELWKLDAALTGRTSDNK
jgi:glycerol uptake operon antiterminator